MARSEYSNGKSHNHLKDNAQSGAGAISANPRSIAPSENKAGPRSKGTLGQRTAKVDPALADLENRLQQRLSLVGREDTKAHRRSGGDPEKGGGKNDDAINGVAKNDPEISRTYEITESIDFNDIAGGKIKGELGVKNGGSGISPRPGGGSTPLHPPSSEAMKWEGIQGNLKSRSTPKNVAQDLARLSPKPGREAGQGNTAATASLTLMSALENKPAENGNSVAPGASRRPDTRSPAPSQPVGSLDSMEFGAPPASPNAPAAALSGSMDSMEFGAESPQPSLKADADMRNSRAALDASLANLVPEHAGDALGQRPIPASPNGLLSENSPAGGQLVARMDLDNDPPPLSTHLNRREPAPDGRRAMVVAGFLGGLSIAFIGVWGYLYTLPRGDQPGAQSAGQGSKNASVDRSNLSLKVDNIFWRSGKALPLNIAIGGDASESGILVKLVGLPSQARLSKGFPTADGEWIVPSNKLFGLALSLDKTPAQSITIGVRLLEKDGNTETGHFSSFSVYPENKGRQATGSVHKIIAANAGMAAIPMPKLMEAQPDVAKVIGLQSGVAANGTSRSGSVDDDEFGGLPEDFKALGNDGGAMNSAMNRVPRQGLATPPVRAKFPNSSNGRVTGERREKVATLTKKSEGTRRVITDAQRALVREGNQLMRGGDIAKARGFYKRAYRGRAPEAALAYGRSYDPNYLGRISNANKAADSLMAMKFYREALSGGLESAQHKIDQLSRSMNKP